MGRIGKNSEPKYSEKDILNILNQYFFAKSSIKYLINNLYVFSWESDYLALTKSGLFYEIEVKISRNDFKNDFKKTKKHMILENNNDLAIHKPNFFYYAVPENLIHESEIPDYAGLIYVHNKYFPYYDIVKKSPQLTKNKINIDELKLTDKFYYNMWQWKNNAENNFIETINSLKKQINEDKIDENGKKYKYTLSEANKRIELLNNEIELNQQTINHYCNECNDLKRLNRKFIRLLSENNIKYDYDDYE